MRYVSRGSRTGFPAATEFSGKERVMKEHHIPKLRRLRERLMAHRRMPCLNSKVRGGSLRSLSLLGRVLLSWFPGTRQDHPVTTLVSVGTCEQTCDDQRSLTTDPRVFEPYSHSTLRLFLPRRALSALRLTCTIEWDPTRTVTESREYESRNRSGRIARPRGHKGNFYLRARTGWCISRTGLHPDLLPDGS